MELRWTQEAAADLERIADYLFEHAPERAERLVRGLYDAPARLLTFPNRGRPGKKEGTRELVMSPLPTSREKW
jgi:plasmid stabilization system protein ParE